MKKNIPPEPGKRIRALREELKLTRAQFEEITGLNALTLKSLETGERALSRLRARILANFFIYIFGLEKPEASEEFLLNGTIIKNDRQK